MSEAVLGAGLHVRGRVTGDGDLRIEAAVEGDVAVTGALELGESCTVQGTLQAESVLVAGDLEGDVQASGPVSITATGKVTGDIATSELTLDEGGQFHGRVDAEFDLPDNIA